MIATPHIRLDSIQALRGIAVLLVLIFHLFEVQHINIIQRFPDLPGAGMQGFRFWTQGYAGVDLFFVISGFIMVYITHARPAGLASVKQFFVSRMTRIYPLWWLFCLILMCFYFFTTGSVVPVDSTGPDMSKPGYLIRSFLLIPQSVPPLLGVGWTLVQEMYFYLVFALLLFLPSPLRYRALPVWAVLSLILCALGFYHQDPHDYLSIAAHPLVLEFLAGAAVGVLFVNGRFIAPEWFFAIGAGLAIMALMLYSDKGDFQYVWGRVLVFTLPVACVVYGVISLEQLGRLSCPTWLIRVGDWSFSLYLSHILVIGVIIRVTTKFAPFLPEGIQPWLTLNRPGLLDNLLFAILAAIASLICAAILYYGFERPLIRFFRQRIRHTS